LLLADSRLPSGGHVHSGGVEALVDRGLVRDVDDLAQLLDGRARTAGLVAAAFAAAGALTAARNDGSAGSRGTWAPWDAALDVRTPSAALREASRSQGTALLRTARLAWPMAAGLLGLAEFGRPHHPVLLGAAAVAAGATAGDAATLAVHHLVGGAATAAVRLLGLDPLRVAAVQAALAPVTDRVACEAAELAGLAIAADDPDLLPADAGPLPEILAELHHSSEVTLFAS
jgi:urease accessory protein